MSFRRGMGRVDPSDIFADTAIISSTAAIELFRSTLIIMPFATTYCLLSTHWYYCSIAYCVRCILQQQLDFRLHHGIPQTRCVAQPPSVSSIVEGPVPRFEESHIDLWSLLPLRNGLQENYCSRSKAASLAGWWHPQQWIDGTN